MAGIENFLSKAGNAVQGFTNPVSSVAGASSGVAGALDGIFGWSQRRQDYYQRRQMSIQQDFQREMFDKQMQAQLDQWNRENEYNDPTNSLKRLASGAAANGVALQSLIGGAGGSGAIASSSAAHKGNTPSLPSAGLAGGPSALPMGNTSLLPVMRMRAEIDNIEASTQEKLKNAGLLDWKTTNEMLQGSVLQSVESLNVALAGKAKSDSDAAKAQSELSKAYTSLVGKQASRYDELTDSQIKANLSQVTSSCAHMLDSIVKFAKAPSEIAQAQQSVKLMISQGCVNYAQAKVFNELRKKYGAETAHQMFENQLFATTFGSMVQAITANADRAVSEAALSDKKKNWFTADKVFDYAEKLARSLYFLAEAIHSDGDSGFADAAGMIAPYMSGATGGAGEVTASSIAAMIP